VIYFVTCKLIITLSESATQVAYSPYKAYSCLISLV